MDEGNLSAPLLGASDGLETASERGSSLWSCWPLSLLCLLVAGCARWRARAPRAPPGLGAEERAAVERLAHRAAVPFDASDESHVDLLRALWAGSYPGEALPGLQGGHWERMGWQGTDPTTDLRAAGHLGLSCLVFFCEDSPEAYGRLLNKCDGARSSFEYPFAAAWVGLVAALVHDLQVATLLPTRSRAAPLAPSRGLAWLLAAPEGDDALPRLAAAASGLVDRRWLAARASYMDYGDIQRAALLDVRRVLDARPATVAEACEALGRLP